MNTAPWNFTHVTLATLTLLAALFVAAPAQAGMEVVMKDGRRVAASTRPVIALGRVNFHDARGRAVSLSATAVNLPATRAALRRELGSVSSGVWTAERLAANDTRVQVFSSSAIAEQGAEPDDAESEGEEEEDKSPSWFQERKDRIQSRIAQVEARKKETASGTTLAAVLDRRHQLLVAELEKYENPKANEAVATN